MYIGPKEAVGSGHPTSHNITYSWPHTSLNITGGVLPGAGGQLSVSTCDLVVSMISLVNNGVQIKSNNSMDRPTYCDMVADTDSTLRVLHSV